MNEIIDIVREHRRKRVVINLMYSAFLFGISFIFCLSFLEQRAKLAIVFYLLIYILLIGKEELL